MKTIAGYNTDEHDFTIMDGFDDCIIGVVTRHGFPPVVCYSRAKVITKLASQGMSEDEAQEFHCFNQDCAWWGDTTPAFLDEI